MWRLAVPARIVLGATFAALAYGDAPAQQVRAQNGSVLSTPAIESMGCLSIRKLLQEFSDSDYRGPGPLPPGHADYPLFDYENSLAEAYFERCRQRPGTRADPSEAFSNGFE